MALINCPECQKEISNKATSCPNCGYPISESKTSIKIDPAPQIRRKYRERNLIFVPMFYFGTLIGIFLSIGGAKDTAIFFFVFSFIGFVGMIINGIGSYLNQP
jgi:hypothetical protein